MKPTEDPILLSNDLNDKSREIEADIKRIQQKRRSYTPPPPPPPRKSKSSRKKSDRLKNFNIPGMEGMEDTLLQLTENMSDQEIEELMEKLKNTDYGVPPPSTDGAESADVPPGAEGTTEELPEDMKAKKDTDSKHDEL